MTRRSFAILLVSLLALPSAEARLMLERPDFNGSYDIVFAGFWKGEGKAAVGAKNVNVNCKVQDSAGREVHIQCSNLSLENGHFTGTGSVDGKPVKVFGRLELSPDQGPPRILGTVCDLQNKQFGRFVGTRKGGSDKGDDKDEKDKDEKEKAEKDKK